MNLKLTEPEAAELVKHLERYRGTSCELALIMERAKGLLASKPEAKKPLRKCVAFASRFSS